MEKHLDLDSIMVRGEEARQLNSRALIVEKHLDDVDSIIMVRGEEVP